MALAICACRARATLCGGATGSRGVRGGEGLGAPAGNRFNGGGGTPLPPNTPALTLPQRHSHTQHQPQPHSQPPVTAPQPLHIPCDRSATALELPQSHPSPSSKALGTRDAGTRTAVAIAKGLHRFTQTDRGTLLLKDGPGFGAMALWPFILQPPVKRPFAPNPLTFPRRLVSGSDHAHCLQARAIMHCS